MSALFVRGGYTVRHTSLDGQSVVQWLCEAFDGCPPDVLLADLSTAIDCLPLRYALKLLQRAWGDDMPKPLCLALFRPTHLALPEWPSLADDFLLPPYAPEEALARVELMLFRKRHIEDGERVAVGEMIIDLMGGRALAGDGAVVPLTPREFDLLRFLAVHRGRFFARERLLDLVWGVDFDGGERTVDIHIRRLRAKLPPLAGSLLETRRGLGYGLQLSGAQA